MDDDSDSEFDAGPFSEASDEVYQEIDILLYLTPPDPLSAIEIDPKEELERMEAELAKHESQRMELAEGVSPVREIHSPEEDGEGATEAFDGESHASSTEGCDQQMASANDADSSMQEEAVAASSDVDAPLSASLSPREQAIGESDETISGESSSDAGMESAHSSTEVNCVETSSPSGESDCPTTPSVVEGDEEDGQEAIEDDAEIEGLAPCELAVVSSRASSEGLAVSPVDRSNHQHKAQDEDEDEDEDDDSVEIVWCGTAPPWEEDPKANEINALLVHACQCEAKRRCHDLQFGELCLNMRRFLCVAYWASHNATWCRSRVAFLLTRLLAYHSLHCLVTTPAACFVPLCSLLRR